MADFMRIIVEMMKDPPSPNDPIPTSNRPATMYGATLPFHILSWIAVSARLYARFKVVREPGMDDLFVILAAIFNLISLICFYGSIPHGIGKHLLLVEQDQLSLVMKWLYVQSAAYYTTTGLIKVSLLCQYLRIFRTGMLRSVSWGLLLLVGTWSIAIAFMAWFPCFPVSGFWNRFTQPPPKCYGFGFGSLDGAYAAFVSFAATNMALDMVIFLLPMTEYFKPGLRKKQVLALTGLFILGSIVVLMSILRLWTALKHPANAISSLDFTWWYPITLIISSLEVDFAIMCASMPIFWPVIVASLTQIFVTKEVHVTHHHRLEDRNTTFEMSGRESLKTMDSQEGLTGSKDFTSMTLSALPKTDYGDRLVRDHVTGRGGGTGIVEVGNEGKEGRSWRSLKSLNSSRSLGH